MLAVVVLVALACIIAWLVRRYRRNAYRRQALLQLQALQAEHREHGDDRGYIEQVNALLKSVALAAYPRADVASRHGEAWRNFLNSSLSGDKQLQANFDKAVYQRIEPGLDTAALHASASHWIKCHRVAA